VREQIEMWIAFNLVPENIAHWCFVRVSSGALQPLRDLPAFGGTFAPPNREPAEDGGMAAAD